VLLPSPLYCVLAPPLLLLLGLLVLLPLLQGTSKGRTNSRVRPWGWRGVGAMRAAAKNCVRQHNRCSVKRCLGQVLWAAAQVQ
jgi:hypothetical protein